MGKPIFEQGGHSGCKQSEEKGLEGERRFFLSVIRKRRRGGLKKKRKHADVEGERWGWMIYYLLLVL